MNRFTEIVALASVALVIGMMAYIVVVGAARIAGLLI